MTLIDLNYIILYFHCTFDFKCTFHFNREDIERTQRTAHRLANNLGWINNDIFFCRAFKSNCHLLSPAAIYSSQATDGLFETYGTGPASCATTPTDIVTCKLRLVDRDGSEGAVKNSLLNLNKNTKMSQFI